MVGILTASWSERKSARQAETHLVLSINIKHAHICYMRAYVQEGTCPTYALGT